ncbi:MAG: hypothetical protein HQL77_17895 [Magnetococcales bacterium]|nr:hypothetical protein [Magnetococcales bacterium]MBF0437218.1 hypothetical protein [Magnetococcales bacterium]
MTEKWTPKMVADRMAEAASSLRRLKVSGLKPVGYGSSWPDIIHEFSEAYGYNDLAVRLGPPTADAITRMDETMEWLRWLESDQVQLVWLHAEGVPRKVIMAKLGVQRTRVWEMWASALTIIVTMLNRKKMSEQSCSNNKKVDIVNRI